jgi:hypothetical protein
MSRRVAAVLAIGLALLVLVVWLAPDRSGPAMPAPSAIGAAGARQPEPAPPERHATVRVRVSSGGAPLAGAAVVVERAAQHSFPPLGSALTGADGVATLTGLPLGSWQLLVVHPERARHRRALELVAEHVELEVSLERGVRIEGSVVDRHGRALADATVRALAPTSNAEHGKQQTDANGAFAIAGLDLGDYRLYVHTGRHRPHWEGPLQFRQHGELRRVRIELEDGRTLSGRVVDAHGDAVVGAHVGASDEGSALVTSDRQGRFELAGLADAPVNIYATAPGHGPTQLRGVLPGGKPIQIVLERAASISGELRLESRAPAVMVSVCRYDPHFGEEICVARQRYQPPEPRFALENLPVGPHDLVIEAEGHSTARVAVILSPGQNFTVSLVVLAVAPDAQ